MQYINGMDLVKSVFKEVEYLIDSTAIQWTDLGEYEDCSVQSFENPTEEGLIFKCVGEIDTSPELPLNVLYNANLQKTWDCLCTDSKKIEQLDSCNTVDFYTFASPLGGIPRNFVFLRNFSIDYDKKVAYCVIRSIHHESVENPSYMKPSGWQFLEVAPNRTRITLVVQISDLMIAPYLRVNSVDLKRIYRNTGIQITHTLPNLIKYIKNVYEKEIINHFKNYQNHHLPIIEVPKNATEIKNDRAIQKHIKKIAEELEYNDIDDGMIDVYKRPLHCFKELSKTIGEVEDNPAQNGWNIYRKFNDLSFYYKDYDESNIDFVCSGSIFIDASCEVISSFIFSDYSCKLDQWTSGMTTLKQIDDVTSLERMQFRSILNPKEELKTILVKQVNHLPKGIIFIGFRSLLRPRMSEKFFWYYPSGYFICPQERGCIVRILLRFRMFVPTFLYKAFPKKKFLYIISEKTRASIESIKTYSINPSYLTNKVFPHWNKYEKYSELAELFSNCHLYPPNNNNGNNGPKKIIGFPLPPEPYENEKKRKFRDNGINSTSITIPTQFCFSTSPPNEQNQQIPINNIVNGFQSSETSKSRMVGLVPNQTICQGSTSLIYGGGGVNADNGGGAMAVDKIEYLSFSPDWENYITKRPFLLLMASGIHLNKPPKKTSKTTITTNESLKTESLFDLLPYEIILFIFSFMDAPYLLKMAQTCKYFNLICSDDNVWKELYTKKYNRNSSDSLFKLCSIEDRNKSNHININSDDHSSGDESDIQSVELITKDQISSSPIIKNKNQQQQQQQKPIINIQQQQQQQQQQQSSQNNNLIAMPMADNNNKDDSNYWRNMFKEKEIVNKNWRTGTPRISQLRGHKSKITCLQLAPDQILTSSKDKEFKSWNIATKQCESTVRNNSTVVSFEKDSSSKLSTEIFPYCVYTHGIIRLGCSNGTIQFYNINTKEIDREQRFIYVSDGFIFNNRDVFSWESNTVKLYDQDTEQLLLSYIAEGTKIKQCKLGKFRNYFFIGSTDKTLRLWDTDSNKITQVFNGHKGAINCIDFLGDYQVLTGSSDKTINFWDFRNSETPLYSIKSHSSKVKAFSMYNNSRMCSGDENSICLWNLNGKPSLLSTIKNLSPVECLSMDDETMLAGFSNGVVTYFDFNA